MDRNFWTEENKIMDYSNLVRADMQNKLLSMSNQIVTRDDIPELCYNYDYFITQKEKAIQFISDYAEKFVNSLDKYMKSTGTVFPWLNNPMRVANLMVLYESKDIVAQSQYMIERADKRIVLNNKNLDDIIKDINGPGKQNYPRLTEKALITRENLVQICLEYVRDGLKNLYQANGTMGLEDAMKQLRRPELSEQVVKTIIKNSYDEVSTFALNCQDINTRDLLLFMEDIVYEASQVLIRDEFDLDKGDVIVDKEFLSRFDKMTEFNQIHQKINFRPETIKEKIHEKPAKLENQKKAEREK